MGKLVSITCPTAPEELRELLIESVRAVLDRKLSPAQAHAVAALSAEVHKSIKMEIVGDIVSSSEKLVYSEGVSQLLSGRGV